MKDIVVKILLVIIAINGLVLGGLMGYYTIGDEFKHYLDLDTGERVTVWVAQGSMVGGVVGCIGSMLAFITALMTYRRWKDGA